MATTNPWKQFGRLLPKSSRLIGTVASHNNNGTSTIILYGGSSITPKGQGVEVGEKTLVEDGKVIRRLPKLPVHNAQI